MVANPLKGFRLISEENGVAGVEVWNVVQESELQSSVSKRPKEAGEEDPVNVIRKQRRRGDQGHVAKGFLDVCPAIPPPHGWPTGGETGGAR